ncbi:hypothetical protein B0H17DRAFT_1204285 [Mycena rosella]|uniref:Uncharacterized protein n=1 Tax=Mycena rosella TaxID=1033263 RepID=A0AAD7D9I5_MYCRO|nr:hypothetical protein B0H17DRAFT_1204285 [Mycena rosella]
MQTTRAAHAAPKSRKGIKKLARQPQSSLNRVARSHPARGAERRKNKARAPQSALKEGTRPSPTRPHGPSSPVPLPRRRRWTGIAAPAHRGCPHAPPRRMQRSAARGPRVRAAAGRYFVPPPPPARLGNDGRPSWGGWRIERDGAWGARGASKSKRSNFRRADIASPRAGVRRDRAVKEGTGGWATRSPDSFNARAIRALPQERSSGRRTAPGAFLVCRSAVTAGSS